MRFIENINTIIRFFGYLLPLFILVFGRGIIWKVINKLRWHEEELVMIIYVMLIMLATIFAIVASYKLFRLSNSKRYKLCQKQLTTLCRIKVAHLAEADNAVELTFKKHHEWLEGDIEHLIDIYSKTVGKQDFEMFKSYVNEYAVEYFSHRVTERKLFLELLNKM